MGDDTDDPFAFDDGNQPHQPALSIGMLIRRQSSTPSKGMPASPVVSAAAKTATARSSSSLSPTKPAAKSTIASNPPGALARSGRDDTALNGRAESASASESKKKTATVVTSSSVSPAKPVVSSPSKSPAGAPPSVFDFDSDEERKQAITSPLKLTPLKATHTMPAIATKTTPLKPTRPLKTQSLSAPVTPEKRVEGDAQQATMKRRGRPPLSASKSVPEEPIHPKRGRQIAAKAASASTTTSPVSSPSKRPLSDQVLVDDDLTSPKSKRLRPEPVSVHEDPVSAEELLDDLAPVSLKDRGRRKIMQSPSKAVPALAAPTSSRAPAQTPVLPAKRTSRVIIKPAHSKNKTTTPLFKSNRKVESDSSSESSADSDDVVDEDLRQRGLTKKTDAHLVPRRLDPSFPKRAPRNVPKPQTASAPTTPSPTKRPPVSHHSAVDEEGQAQAPVLAPRARSVIRKEDFTPEQLQALMAERAATGLNIPVTVLDEADSIEHVTWKFLVDDLYYSPKYKHRINNLKQVLYFSTPKHSRHLKRIWAADEPGSTRADQDDVHDEDAHVHRTATTINAADSEDELLRGAELYAIVHKKKTAKSTAPTITPATGSAESASEDEATQDAPPVKKLRGRGKAAAMSASASIPNTPVPKGRASVRREEAAKAAAEKEAEETASDLSHEENEDNNDDEDDDGFVAVVQHHAPGAKVRATSATSSVTAARKRSTSKASRVQDENVEAYFHAERRDVADLTSDRTFSRMHVAAMDRATVEETIRAAQTDRSLEQEREELMNKHRSKFSRWLMEMENDFNLLFYGLGSKQMLLNEFAELHLREGFPLVVVNGFFTALTIKQLLNTITTDILKFTGSFRSLMEHCEFIRLHLASANVAVKRIYLLIHNIDGPNLRKDREQNILAYLAAIPSIRMIASIDHINAPLMWDQKRYGQFNWLWHDVTSFAPYTQETTFDGSLSATREAPGIQSAMAVLRNLNENAINVFRLLAEYQLNLDDDDSSKGIAFPTLYQKCREGFYVPSEFVLRTQLVEFRDHDIVNSTRGGDGLEYLHCSLDKDRLLQVIEEIPALLEEKAQART